MRSSSKYIGASPEYSRRSRYIIHMEKILRISLKKKDVYITEIQPSLTF